MDLFEAIAARHSYRGAFRDVPVLREDLKKIVEAGIMAPSGCNTQTTSFVMVDDPFLLKRIGELVPKKAVQTAKAIIVVIARHVPAYSDMYFDVQDYSASVQNMLLAVTGLGYATVWLDGVLRHNGLAERIAALLHLPKEQHMNVSVILPIGVPEETGKQNDRMPFEQRAWYNLHE